MKHIHLPVCILLLNLARVVAFAQGTAFTYQGRLTDGADPATGLYDLRFVIYDAPSGGNAVGRPLTNDAVAASKGLFTVSLDFGGGVFNGAARWLEIGVRTNGSPGPHTALSPRQPVTPAPYAMLAAGFTGAVLDSQLSALIPRLNAAQVFTGTTTFSPASGPPFAVGSSTRVENLNADLVDGLDSSAFLLKAEQCVETIAQLKARPPGFAPCVAVLGYYARGDGGGGLFHWDASESSADNGGTVIVTDSYPPLGRWKRDFDGTISVRWFGATGTADDTIALRAALASVPHSGSMVRVPPGNYRVSSFLPLKSKTHLQGAGSASRFQRTNPSAWDVIFLSETVSNVTVESIAIDLNAAGGGQTSLSFASGVAFVNQCSDIRIRDVRIFDSSGTNVCCRHGILVLDSDHVWIERNFLSHGLRIKAGGAGDKVVIANNVLEDPNDNAISIATARGNSRTVSYVIRGNTLTAARGAGIFIGDDGFGVVADPGVPESGIIYENILVDGNILIGPVTLGSSMVLMRLANATKRLHIVNNVLVNVGPLRNFTQGISASIQTPYGRNGADFLVAHNSLDGPFDEGAIWVRSVKGVRIAGNQIANGSVRGIRLTQVDTATVDGNQVRDAGIGLLIENSVHVQAMGNSVRSGTSHGMGLISTDPTNLLSGQFTANAFVDNGGGGILTSGAGAFDVHFLFNDLRSNAGGAFQNYSPDAHLSAATRLGNLGASEYIQRHISATAAWDPPSVVAGAIASTTVSAGGATVGDTVAVGFTRPMPAGSLLAGSVTAANTVTVTLVNLTGGTMNLDAGTVRVDVWKH
jgi:hypothetical protein